MNTNEIQPRQFSGGWLVARNMQVYGKLNDGHEIVSFEAWTGDRWSWHSSVAKQFRSHEDADGYIVQNRERLGIPDECRSERGLHD